jgi:hypothetical protein
MTMATKTRSASEVAAAAVTAFVRREMKAPMRKLGIPSRAALLREWRQLQPIRYSWDYKDARRKYPAATRRIWALWILQDLPKIGVDDDGLSTIEFCFDQLAEALPGALPCPLSKGTITNIRALIEADEARREASGAQWRADYERRKAEYAAQRASKEFAQWITGEAEIEENSEAA